MASLPLPSAYRWRDLRRPAALDRAPARRAAEAIVGAATVDTVDRPAAEAAIERALVAAYGLWAVGWRWSASEGGSGGPVAAWCCDEHSILPEEEPDPDAAATIERVVAALGEWWDVLGELEARFAALAGEPIERAAAALLAFAVARTRVEDDWHQTFAAFVRWYLEAGGRDPAAIRPIVDRAIAGRLESWSAPDPATAAVTCAELARALAEPPVAPADGLAAWAMIRDRKLLPAPIGSPRVAVAGDGHRRFIDRIDGARDPARAARLHAAVDVARADATRGDPLTADRLAAWLAIGLGEPSGFRTPAHADRLADALAYAAERHVPTAIRAARVFLDVSYLQAFGAGNGRAARLALEHVLTTSGLMLHVAEPLLLLPRDPTDLRGLWWHTFLIDRLIGPGL